MSWINNYKGIRCDECGKICSPVGVDEYVPFGCQGPECLEPLDAEHICKKCFPKVKKEWIKEFKEGYRNGDFQKSRAETEAAEECGLRWVNSGVGILGTRYFLDSHQYVNKELYESMEKLPYWGWCMKCGSERDGGYCSNKKCDNCFESKKDINEKMKSMHNVNYDVLGGLVDITELPF
ncbi:hypothetical protein KY314_00245 [Candidatus Woesearchaeota archaeon]|nr:hypothetical protein [Candidatus Woesearchaeota archaeon]